jgi:hypothetical protein
MDWNADRIFAVSTFIVGLPLALYASGVKELLHTRARTGTQSWLKSRLAVDRQTKRRLERLHNNPYNLVLYLAFSIFQSLKLVVYFYVFAFIALSLLRTFWSPIVPTISPVLFVGLVFGRVVVIADTVKQLWDYDESTRKVDVQIAELQKRITS